MYASIGRVVQEKRAYRSKLVRPKAVTETCSYFRAISLWFSDQNRHLVLATGKNINRAESMSEDTVTSQSGTIFLTSLTIIQVYLSEKRDRMLKTMHIWM
jgi:hypothetical protein